MACALPKFGDAENFFSMKSISYVTDFVSMSVFTRILVQPQLGMRIAICHLPPGTSKWNTIEHRMFAPITQNWRGKPLVSHEVIVHVIGSTTLQTGLTIRAALDTRRYATGRKIPDAECADLHGERALFHGEWNHTIVPREPMN